MSEHSCDWCPMEVRGLFAVAHNASGAYENRVFDAERAERKMTQLKAYLELIQPLIDRHFEESL